MSATSVIFSSGNRYSALPSFSLVDRDSSSLDRLHVSWSRDLDEDIHQEMWHRLSDLSTKAGELSQLSSIVHM